MHGFVPAPGLMASASDMQSVASSKTGKSAGVASGATRTRNGTSGGNDSFSMPSGFAVTSSFS
eukprot:2027150-Prorocentrum_lima.AAC.1